MSFIAKICLLKNLKNYLRQAYNIKDKYNIKILSFIN